MTMTELLGALLLDLDGTLIDTAPDMGGALNLLLQEEGKPPLPLADIRAHVSHGSKALVALGFGSDLPPHREQELIARYLHCYTQCVAVDSTLFQGMDSLLAQLESRGIPWGIVTNKPIRYTVPLLQHLELLQRCSTLVCGDSMALSKPDPAPLYLACQHLKLDPSRCIYAGDAERDIAAGAAAGMRTVLVEWGYFSAEEDTPNWGAAYHCADAEALRQVCE